MSGKRLHGRRRVVTTTWCWMKSLFGRAPRRRVLGVRRKPARFLPNILLLERRDTPAVAIKGGFEGIRFNDPGAIFAPPDTDAAVGPTAILETVSNAATLRAKDGTVLSNIDLMTMFPPATAAAILLEPNVVYDDNS